MLRRLSAAVATIREDHAREDQTWKSCTGDGAGDWIQGHKGAWGRACGEHEVVLQGVNKVLAPSEAGTVRHEHGLQSSPVNCTFLDNRKRRRKKTNTSQPRSALKAFTIGVIAATSGPAAAS